MWEYSQKLKDHFFNPRNVGEIKDPSGVGEVGSLACGDALRLYVKVNDAGVIEEATFKTFGCGSAIASASALTEMIKGKTVEEASRITNRDIADFLGGIPPEKMHCSVMGREALEAALNNFKGLAPSPEQIGHVVCKCFGVTDEEIKRVVRENRLKTVEDVTHYTKAGGGCGQCKPEIEKLLNEVLAEEMKKEKPAARPLTNLQRIKLIEEALEREIRPALRTDGGDIDLIDVDGNRVVVALRGACAHCIGADATLSGYVEKKLRELVDPEIVLVEAAA